MYTSSPNLFFISSVLIFFLVLFSVPLFVHAQAGGVDGGGFGVSEGGTGNSPGGYGGGSASGPSTGGTGGRVSVTMDPTTGLTSMVTAENVHSTPGIGITGMIGVPGDAGDLGLRTTPPPTTCTSAADIIVTDIALAPKNAPTKYVKSNDLDIGSNYVPSVLVANVGCSATDTGEVDTDFRNQSPRGENGTFPVRLQIDFDKDGDIDYDEVVNSAGPLKAGETAILAFPDLLADVSGDHTATASADPHSMPKVGCSGGWGCVKETNETNRFTLNFSITEPWINLGSFRWVDDERCTLEDPGASSYRRCDPVRAAKRPVVRSLYRTVEESVYTATDPNEEIGLLWDGHKVIFSTCTGNRSDFNGRFDSYVLTEGFPAKDSRANKSFSLRKYDLFIDEPPRLETHTYIITCKTTGGGTVSDTHILNGGADISGFIDLTPTAEDKAVEAEKVLRNYNFDVKNEGIIDVNEFAYSVSIRGTDVTRGDGSAPITNLKVDDTQTIPGALRWRAPDSDTNVPIEVCITHPDMDGERCDTARLTVTTDPDELSPKQCEDKRDNDDDKLIDANDPGCWTDPKDPDTYDPTDDDETNTTPTDPKAECEDGDDNDGDGATDFPADAGCTSESDDDESEDPTITADPTIVRYGENSTVEWDPKGNSSCSFSKNMDIGGTTDSSGSKDIPITAETTFTISCTDDEGATREASVTVQALPLLYET